MRVRPEGTVCADTHQIFKLSPPLTKSRGSQCSKRSESIAAYHALFSAVLVGALTLAFSSAIFFVAEATGIF